MNSAISIEVLRADAPAVLLGVLILIAGAMSSLLFALRPRPRDSALLYFGIAASMYGLRLIATTRLVRQAFSGTAMKRMQRKRPNLPNGLTSSRHEPEFLLNGPGRSGSRASSQEVSARGEMQRGCKAGSGRFGNDPSNRRSEKKLD